MKHIFATIFAVMIAMLSVPALAAAEPIAEQNCISVSEIALSPKLYPAEVITKEQNGTFYLEKMYILSASDDPADIDTADCVRDGRTYKLLDVLKNDMTETDSKEHIEVLTKNTKTKDLSKILPLFEPTLELSTEDGYSGVLTLDHTSVTVEAAGYSSSTREVTATRTYPNLSDADLSLVPKTIDENGRTLTLSDVKWDSAAANTVDGYELAIRYTATATYTGTATSSYATGYIAKANYIGEITKSTNDTIIYTAVFAAEKQSDTDSGFQFDMKWLIIPAVIVITVSGYFGYKYYINKKRGYE